VWGCDGHAAFSVFWDRMWKYGRGGFAGDSPPRDLDILALVEIYIKEPMLWPIVDHRVNTCDIWTGVLQDFLTACKGASISFYVFDIVNLGHWPHR